MPELRVSLHSFLLSALYVVQWAYYGPFRPLKVQLQQQRQRGEERAGRPPRWLLRAPSPARPSDGRTVRSSWQFLPPRNAYRNALARSPPSFPPSRRPLS